MYADLNRCERDRIESKLFNALRLNSISCFLTEISLTEFSMISENLVFDARAKGAPVFSPFWVTEFSGS